MSLLQRAVTYRRTALPPYRHQERIRLAFYTNGRRWSVPAVHDGRIGQSEELGMDTLHQGRRVAAGQIGPADGSAEQDIPAQDHPVANERHVAR